MEEKKEEKVFPTIGEVAEAPSEHLPTIVKSLCMKCHEQGETRLLLTDIPFFRQIILSSFSCPFCYYRTTGIDENNPVQNKGVKIIFKIKSNNDLQRQLVKSQYASVYFRELELEIPPKVGKFTTLEGLLQNTMEDLSLTLQKVDSIDVKVKLIDFVKKIRLILESDEEEGCLFPLTCEINDPSGNSCIENIYQPSDDPNLKIYHFIRTKQQNKELNLDVENVENSITAEERERQDQAKDESKKNGSLLAKSEKEIESETMKQENLRIPSDCSNCQKNGYSEMCVTNIPFFKEIIIFAFNCNHCGFKDNEIKTNTSISSHGKKITLSLKAETCEVDFKRDIVKSTSSAIYIPEIELEVTIGSLGGMYTTLEGLLNKIYDKFCSSSFLFDHAGDSINTEKKNKFDTFKSEFKAMIEGERDFTFILDDPLDNSFIYSEHGYDNDERIQCEIYQRSYQQNEEFGLNDINVDNYDDNNDEQDDTEKADEQEMKQRSVDKKLVEQKMSNLQRKGKETHPHQQHVSMPSEYAHESLD